MKCFNKSKAFLAILLLVLLLTAITGCGRLLRRPQEKNQGGQRKDPPQALSGLEEDTSRLLEQLEDVKQQRAQRLREQEHPSKTVELPPELKTGQEVPTPAPTSVPMPAVDWTDFDKTVEALHDRWNSFEPKARADGAETETIRAFEAQLNALTEQTLARSESQAYLASNRLYGYLPEFFNLYKHQQPPEVKTLKYLARQILIHGEEKDWAEADEILADMKKAWQTAKARMDKPDQALNQKIDAALGDFEDVVHQQNLPLSRIKGALLIKNLDEVK